MSELYQFMGQVATSMGRKPQDMDQFTKILEDNWFNTVEQLTTITDQQWSDLKLPIGLVNQIKKKLQDLNPVTQQVTKQQSSKEESKMEIDQIDSKPVVKTQTSGQNLVSKEDMIRAEVSENCLDALMEIQNTDTGSNTQMHRDIVKILLTIVANLLEKPLDPQVRKINKTGKAAQGKILPFKNAIRFLKIVNLQNSVMNLQVGFDFESDKDNIELQSYRKEVLESAQESINAHIMSLGGKVVDQNPFDPYKSGLSSTKFDRLPVQRDGNIDFYDPTAVQAEIDKIVNAHNKALQETVIKDRDIKVFNIQHTGKNLKTYLMDLEQEEQQRLSNLKLTEEKLQQQLEQTSALKFLADVEKMSQFKNKRQEMLERMQKQATYTTALIRIRFPDDYVLQGTFGGLEKVEDVYNFVKSHIILKEREFYLYETPPKKIIKEMKQSLKQARMVPSGMLYFAWTDLDQTKSTDGPFLDIASLKNKILAF